MSSAENISDVDKDSFATFVLEKSHQVPVLVDFWAAWCNPCKMLMPLLANLADEYQGKFFLAKVDTDVERDLAQQYGIRSLPTVKIFRFGEMVDEFSGVIPEGEIRALIDNYVERESDRYYNDALSAIENNDFDSAKQHMQKAFELDPEKKNIILALADIYIKTDEIANAENLLNKLPFNLQTDEDVEGLKARLSFAMAVQAAPELAVLEQSTAANPKDYDSLFQLGSRYAMMEEYEKALETFLKLMTTNKNYNEGAPRKAMLAIFDILGGGPLVNIYRSKMASALL